MVYREETRFFSMIFYVILALVIAASLLMQVRFTGSAILPIILALALPLLFGRMLVTVSGRTLLISIGYLSLIKKEIPLGDIREARVVEYRPIRQFGGWGIRSGTFEGIKTGCYTMKGTSGVLLSLGQDVRVCITKTNRLIIGSGTPEKLKASLQR